MRVLLLGGGGREHALAWKISQSPLCESLIVAPGNGGIAAIAECAPLDIEDPAAVLAFCRSRGVDFVVFGSEAPLAAGVSDMLAEAGVEHFGPSQAAARLETSKAFTKEVCAACGAPTAASQSFADADSAIAHIRTQSAPIIVKQDGLAAGKGVTVADTREQAIAAVRDIAEAGGERILIEDYLAGEEASFFVLCDGESLLPLVGAQDHKRARDGDEGPNTGGMGAYSPAPVFSAEVEARAMTEIIRPIAAEMARRGTPYRGVIYAGLMIDQGAPTLIEINARFGDPETQVLMLRLQSDLLPALVATARGALGDVALEWLDDAAVTVVMAARGYPGAYSKGERIAGLAKADAVAGATLFQAGTRVEDGDTFSHGGRVLNICATGEDFAQARERAYRAVAEIDWPGGFFRRDIGWRALGGDV